jgi:cell wall-associated NlpC family hydrolase
LKDPLKPRDKITQKMTRDGAIAENQTTGDTERISNRIRDADLQKTPEQQAAQDAMQLPPVSDTSPLPHVPGAAPKADTGKTERVMKHIDAAHTRKASKKAVRKAQAEATAGTKSSRLQFTDEERAAPELEKYIKKSDKAADRLDKAKAAIPKEKKLVKERTFDETTGKGKTRLHFEEKDKPPGFKEKHNPLSRPTQEAGILVHNKIHSVEKDNSGVEGAHKSEEAAERGLKYGARKIKQGYRSHKLKPYREAAKAEKAAFKANVDFQYHKTLHENPQLTSNPISRFWQKQKIKRQYAKEARNTAKGIKGAAERTRKAAAKAAEKTKQTAAFVARHPAGVAIAVGVLLLFIMVMSGLSSCGAMFSGALNGVLGTSYTSEDSDLVEVENSYAGLENELQSRIGNIERDNPGYDEYRYDLANIGHNPHELASYLTAKYQSYTRADVQAELQRIFEQQYKLTLTEEIEVRYRTETRTGTTTVTDPETGETTTETYEYEVEVPYNYYILNIKLTNTPLSAIAENNLTPEQLEMYRVYLQTSGNKPLIFGGGSPDTSASEDLSGVDFVNGTRPGNTAIVDLAKRQVGNVGGYPYWSWYGFNSRVEWCACFVSWCYGQMGLSEPRFAACQSQGIPWFTSHGQWGARGYENIAPGDAIFFDWDLDGSADHVGLVIGRDEGRVYTVEGNSGDACKIKSYPLDYACIKGYGLMNWN